MVTLVDLRDARAVCSALFSATPEGDYQQVPGGGPSPGSQMRAAFAAANVARALEATRALAPDATPALREPPG